MNFFDEFPADVVAGRLKLPKNPAISGVTRMGDAHHVALVPHRVILSAGGALRAAGVEGPLSLPGTTDMRQERQYYVYILGSFSGTLYIGVTGNLRRRIWQHKQHAIDGFAAKYDVTRLLYFETYNEVLNAIAREKQLKGWSRAKKIALIEKLNPKWVDLSREWYRPEVQQLRVNIAHPEEFRG